MILDDVWLLEQLRDMGTKYLPKKEYRERWTKEKPTTGYCYIVSEFVYKFIDNTTLTPHRMITKTEEVHWFLVLNDGSILDYTKDQYDFDLDYSQGKPRSFFPQTSRGANELYRRYMERYGTFTVREDEVTVKKEDE